MAIKQQSVQVQRWAGNQHPTLSTITKLMRKEQLRPYMWENSPNYRYAVRTHGYDKVLYVVEGTLEIMLPDFNQRVKLHAGDRIEIPSGTRHGTTVGHSGAKCVEATINRHTRSSSN